MLSHCLVVPLGDFLEGCRTQSSEFPLSFYMYELAVPVKSFPSLIRETEGETFIQQTLREAWFSEEKQRENMVSRGCVGAQRAPQSGSSV